MVISNLKYVATFFKGFGFECLDEINFNDQENELPYLVYKLSFHKIDDAIKKMKDLGTQC